MTTVPHVQSAIASRRVAVTRASDQGEELIALLRARGAVPIVAPTIEIRPPEGADSTYRSAEDTEWARAWPMEEIWRCRRI